MNKEIKDRLDKLENELKESKDEIHSLKSSVSLKIEKGIGKLFSRFTRKQIILGSLIVLFSISIIGIAGTVTKTYTFSSGDVVSASKINTNFDTLYTLVNGNLDDNNISGISGSKITSGTVAAALEGTLEGIPAMAVSVASFQWRNFNFAGEFAMDIVENALTKNWPRTLLLNLNIPPCSPEKMGPLRWTRLSIRHYEEQFSKRTDPRGDTYYWLAGEAVKDLQAAGDGPHE